MFRFGVHAGPVVVVRRRRRPGQFPVVGAFWAILVTVAAVVVWPWILAIAAGVMVLAMVAHTRR